MSYKRHLSGYNRHLSGHNRHMSGHNRHLSGYNRHMSGYNKPVHQNDFSRAGGIASFMRLPVQDTAAGLDVCFVGVPIDTGTSNRSVSV